MIAKILNIIENRKKKKGKREIMKKKKLNLTSHC
jgi:hypothetical protein